MITILKCETLILMKEEMITDIIELLSDTEYNTDTKDVNLEAWR